MSTHSEIDVRQDPAFRLGYQKGEMERIALATANSDLRSDNLKLSQQLEEALKACSWVEE